MRQRGHSSRWEMGFLLAAVVVYVTGQLGREAAHVQALLQRAGQSQVPAALLEQGLASYEFGRHAAAPLLGGATLLVLAWSGWRFLALPEFAKRPPGHWGWLYLVLTSVLLVGGVWLYHYLKLYVRPVHTGDGALVGLRTYSRYRQLTVFADAVAVSIALGSYELLAYLSRYLRRQLATEADPVPRYLAYGLLAGAAGGLLLGAATGQLSFPLWNAQTAAWWLVAGFGLLVLVLQYLAAASLQARPPAGWAWAGHLLRWVGVGLVGGTMLWVAYTREFPLARRPLAGLILAAGGAGALIAALRRTRVREQQALETQASHSAAELAALQAQINPHFLFNALNSLYATALQGDGDKTAQGIQQLGDMMRFMLEENHRERIPLGKEVDYLRSYIDLQRLRLDESQGMDIRVTIQTPTQDIYLAPMLLSPFVENAFNHGISLWAPSWIHVTLTLDEQRLFFKVHNSRHPRPDTPALTSPGVGLANVRQRLALLYPGRHELLLQCSEQDYFVSLTLHYR